MDEARAIIDAYAAAMIWKIPEDDVADFLCRLGDVYGPENDKEPPKGLSA